MQSSISLRKHLNILKDRLIMSDVKNEYCFTVDELVSACPFLTKAVNSVQIASKNSCSQYMVSAIDRTVDYHVADVDHQHYSMQVNHRYAQYLHKDNITDEELKLESVTHAKILRINSIDFRLNIYLDLRGATLSSIVELLNVFNEYAELRSSELLKKAKKDKLVFGISYLSKLNEKAKEINDKYYFENDKNTFIMLRKEPTYNLRISKFTLRRKSAEQDFNLVYDNLHILIEHDAKFSGFIKKM